MTANPADEPRENAVTSRSAIGGTDFAGCPPPEPSARGEPAEKAAAVDQ